MSGEMSTAAVVREPGTGFIQGFRLNGQDVAGGIVNVTADLTITTANRHLYDGKTLVWTGAFTVTLSAGLGNFGFIGEPPAAMNASIAATGVTLNGAATTLLRTPGAGFAVYAVGTNAFRVTGA